MVLFVLLFPVPLFSYRFIHGILGTKDLLLIILFWPTILWPAYVYTYHKMLYRCWEKLIIYDDKIVWKCLFYPRVTLLKEDIKIKSIRTFDEAEGCKVPDHYNVGRDYIILSSFPVPNFPLVKIRSKKGIIKYPYDKRLQKELRNRHIY